MLFLHWYRRGRGYDGPSCGGSSTITTIPLPDHDNKEYEDEDTLITTGLSAFQKGYAWFEDAGSNWTMQGRHSYRGQR